MRLLQRRHASGDFKKSRAHLPERRPHCEQMTMTLLRQSSSAAGSSTSRSCFAASSIILFRRRWRRCELSARSPFSAPIPLVWAEDRPDAAEGRLRQVYAELGGMIGGNHKSERTQVAN